MQALNEQLRTLRETQVIARRLRQHCVLRAHRRWRSSCGRCTTAQRRWPPGGSEWLRSWRRACRSL